MARLNDDAQWIVLMGFIVSFSLFFLAILINQSTVVGQTTAEAVSEFPKNDIRGVREVIIASESITDTTEKERVQREIKILSLSRQNAAVDFSAKSSTTHTYIDIHYNNGVAAYNETYTTS
ncbi:hypothetical protein [Methanoregula sp.]|uniref:hypothetical protein n=1 Tax=Methanoregula sp. TaxID=2052170 RepID=UPI00236FA4B4|nr:hypothetical protein [Methanoregula sp.]MDD1686265.1 hypothetical protein [Methanoregula sp.]